MSQKTSVLLAFSLVILSVAQNLLGAPEGEELKDVSTQCREQYSLNPEEIEVIKPGQHVDTTDQRIKCFMKCILTGVGVMNEDGDLTTESSHANLRKYHSFFPACINVTGTDACDKALNFHNCIWKESNQNE